MQRAQRVAALAALALAACCLAAAQEPVQVREEDCCQLVGASSRWSLQCIRKKSKWCRHAPPLYGRLALLPSSHPNPVHFRVGTGTRLQLPPLLQEAQLLLRLPRDSWRAEA